MNEILRNIEDSACTGLDLSPGCSGCELALTEIRRLMEENKRIRYKLNHQTEDDVEACRQGKHKGTNCGAE